ncbi:MAG: glutamine-hydrolyzing carbamoyl-phosphate synthase small subunit [Candidatus Hadarchaeales archaeon]
MVKKAILALEDGTVVRGLGFGACGEAIGEIVFNTAMVGYVEALTDPSYKGQILMMTYPLIGNYGYSPEWHESDSIKAEGFVVREACKTPSHPKSIMTISEFLEREGIPGIEGVDTRALTLKIREYGTMKSALAVFEEKDEPDPQEILKKAKEQPHITERDLVPLVSRKEKTRIDVGGDLEVVLIDCGVKQSIINSLLKRKINLTIVPFDTPADEILEMRPDGVFLSNGPGDPARVKETIETVKKLLGSLPLIGICLGHQLLALACGAKTFKLKFGHRGINQPVKDLKTGRVFISSQNHGFAVDENSLDGTGLRVTQLNPNDWTVEGIEHTEIPLFSVQYHPEASPGPNDTLFFFDEVARFIKRWKECQSVRTSGKFSS